MNLSREKLTPAARLYFWISDRLYHELAWAFDGVTSLLSLGRWAGWRKTALTYVVGTRVLELGSGSGELLVELERGGVTGYGLDRSMSMQHLAARRLRRQGMRLRCVQAEALRLPFGEAAFDSIVSIFPAGFLLDVEALREVSRTLVSREASRQRCAGRLIVVGLCLQSNNRLLRHAMRLLFGAAPETVLGDFARLAASAGLRVVEIIPGNSAMPVPIVIAEKGGA
jgi:ubiquinone/menaquinone biosynthesis C-methylase UbiE